MAKTFNPNRVGGGGVSIVRAADGTYSLKETGFDQISSLNMVDLSAVATTTTAAKTDTATDITGTTVEDQTKQAFLLPKQDRGDDPFTTEKMLKSATDVSKDLQTTFERPNMRDIAGNRVGTFNATTFDDAVGTRIKDPTESVFGTTTLEDDPLVKATKVETPAQKTNRVTSSDVQSGKADPPLKGLAEKAKDKAVGFFNKYIAGEKSKINTEKGSEVTQAGMPPMLGDTGKNVDQMSGVMPDFLDPTGRTGASNTLGITADPSALSTQAQQEAAALGLPDRFKGVSTMGALAGKGEKDNFVSIPAKKTFRESVNTALKGVGEAVQFISPIMGVVQALGKQRNETDAAIAVNKSRFNVVTSSGPMQGRIVGDDGTYDPANNLFHGMNRDSAFGNLEDAGRKRIDRINKTLEKQKDRPGGPSQTLIDRRDKFQKELIDYQSNVQQSSYEEASGSGSQSDSSNDKDGCVIATHAVNSGAFTADTKREAVRWCVKNLHRTWWGEAIRRGYRYYGQKAINEGNAKNHYQEFKNYVAFGTGKKRTLKTAWTFIYRTIQFFIKGVTIKK